MAQRRANLDFRMLLALMPRIVKVTEFGPDDEGLPCSEPEVEARGAAVRMVSLLLPVLAGVSVWLVAKSSAGPAGRKERES